MCHDERLARLGDDEGMHGVRLTVEAPAEVRQLLGEAESPRVKVGGS
jgi:hypothetical protein